jgi:hypothetical protein
VYLAVDLLDGAPVVLDVGHEGRWCDGRGRRQHDMPRLWVGRPVTSTTSDGSATCRDRGWGAR